MEAAVALKFWYIYTRLHNATYQKIIFRKTLLNNSFHRNSLELNTRTVEAKKEHSKQRME